MEPQSEALNWTSRFGFVDIQQRLELCQSCQFGSSGLSGDLILAYWTSLALQLLSMWPSLQEQEVVPPPTVTESNM